MCIRDRLVLEFNRRILLGDLFAQVKEKSVADAKNIRLVHGSYFLAGKFRRIFEGKLCNPLTPLSCQDAEERTVSSSGINSPYPL